MPIYEYHCQKCGHQFDTRRSIINTNKPTPAKITAHKKHTQPQNLFSLTIKAEPKNPPVVTAAAVMAEPALLTGINKKYKNEGLFYEHIL